MNFLSHLYLSGNSEELLLGNYIADSVKGKGIENYPPGIQEGIRLHRKIDAFTDTHPVVEESKIRLRPAYRKYSPVIVDIYYDHFLAANWKRYSQQDLSEFSENVYAILDKHQAFLPEKSKAFTFYMKQHKLLEAYGKLSGIEQVLAGMARRTPFVSNMEYASRELADYYDLFEQEFHRFFPELIQFVNAEIQIS